MLKTTAKLAFLSLIVPIAVGCSSGASSGGGGYGVGGTWPAADGFGASLGDGSRAATDTGANSNDANPACTPNCAGLSCGDDGCGGQCGVCPQGQACLQDGVCKELASSELCANVSCDVNAYCTVVDGKASCECKLRYEGNGKSCKDVDECKTDNGGCDEHAFCTNKVGAAPTCDCMPGFTGNGLKCLDIDECKTGAAKCGLNSACVNTAGSWECNCDAGFSKTGSGCVDIDECATPIPPCDPNAKCSNNPGSFSCKCNVGYKGNGYVCNQDKDCGGTCDLNAKCVPKVGAASVCECGPGFSGSGVKCYPVPSTVTMMSVILSPFDPDDNKTWDGGTIPESDRLKFEKLLGDAAKAYATGNWLALIPSVASLAGFVSNLTSAPDPVGSVELASQGKTVGSWNLSQKDNTHAPSWSGVTWNGVIIDASTKMTLNLYDSDVLFNDLIGTVGVSGKDLLKALEIGGVFPVDVHNQGKKAIVFVEVQVTPAYDCGNGQCDSKAGEKSFNCPQDCGGTTGGGGGHFCDANCGSGNAAQTCFCDADCKQYGDCCDITGTAKAGNSCVGSTCGLCK